MRISEEAVFRWVVIIGVAAASVIVLTLLTRPLVGAIWFFVLVAAGLWHASRWVVRKRRGS
jgi:Flp pilus assembly protein TadB